MFPTRRGRCSYFPDGVTDLRNNMVQKVMKDTLKHFTDTFTKYHTNGTKGNDERKIYEATKNVLLSHFAERRLCAYVEVSQ